MIALTNSWTSGQVQVSVTTNPNAGESPEDHEARHAAIVAALKLAYPE